MKEPCNHSKKMLINLVFFSKCATFALKQKKMKKILLILTMTLSLMAASVCTVAMPAAQSDVASSLAVAQPTVRALHGGLELGNPLEGAMTFAIYSITGQLVKQVDVAAGSAVSVDLPTGCYIVKCAKWSKKIVVR